MNILKPVSNTTLGDKRETPEPRNTIRNRHYWFLLLSTNTICIWKTENRNQQSDRNKVVLFTFYVGGGDNSTRYWSSLLPTSMFVFLLSVKHLIHSIQYRVQGILIFYCSSLSTILIILTKRFVISPL